MSFPFLIQTQWNVEIKECFIKIKDGNVFVLRVHKSVSMFLQNLEVSFKKQIHM